MGATRVTTRSQHLLYVDGSTNGVTDMAKKSTDNKAALTKLANSIAGHVETLDGTHTIVRDICDECTNLYNDAPIPKEDMGFIAAEVARVRGWTAASARVRIAELKAVLNAYSKLPVAIDKALSKHVAVPFYKAVALARSLNAGKTPTQAANMLKQGASATKAKPASERNKTEQVKSANTHVKRILEQTKLPKAFRDALKSLAVQYDVLTVE